MPPALRGQARGVAAAVYGPGTVSIVAAPTQCCEERLLLSSRVRMLKLFSGYQGPDVLAILTSLLE